MNFIDAPIKPVMIVPEYLWSKGTVKLSWTGNATERMDHNYTIVVHNVTRSRLSNNIISSPLTVIYESVVVPFIFFDQCGEFDVQVRSVNRAGESAPSDSVRVSLPLLPDIQPVSDSLDHRVWKESSSQLMVQILFEVSDIYFTNGYAIYHSFNVVNDFFSRAYSQRTFVHNKQLQSTVFNFTHSGQMKIIQNHK